MILLGNIEARSGFDTGIAALTAGGHAATSVVDSITCVENDVSVRTVGHGGYPNLLGYMELDACIIDGTTRKTGAVGGMRVVRNPIQTAYHVMEKLPHEMLVGQGADRFALECGQPAQDALTDCAKQKWADKLERYATPRQWQEFITGDFTDGTLTHLSGLTQDPETVVTPKDTTIMLAQDCHGTICAGGSTSGWAWKYPGRLGDCPIVGAGLYAHSPYGAVGCTHMGEMTMRGGTARYIITLLSEGYDLKSAMFKGALDLKSIYEQCHNPPMEGVVIHGIDAERNHLVLALHCPDPVAYWVWTPEQGIDKKTATPV